LTGASWHNKLKAVGNPVSRHRISQGQGMSQMLIGTLKSCVFAACIALSGCAMPLVDDETEFAAVMPAPSTSSAEIASAIQDLIKTYPVCSRLRALRLVGRPAAKLDPHAFDGNAEADLDVLVRLGYLTKTAFPDLGKLVLKYDRTERGQDTNIIGPNGFCFPADRVLVSVTSVEREIDTHGLPAVGPVSRASAARFGHLVVKFTHTADPNSIWAREPGLIKLVAGRRAVLLPGPAEGRALLSRVWIRGEHPLKGAPDSGALWALSRDRVHNRFEGGRWGGITLHLWEVD
jgi:hypothetical protein